LEDFPSISLNLIDGSVLVDCYDDLLARNWTGGIHINKYVGLILL
jgi:hypothetical protein